MTLNYQTPGKPIPTNHDAVYSSLLAAFAFFLLMGVGFMVWMMWLPTTPANTKPAFQLIVFTEAAYGAVSLLVLLIRILLPTYRRWPTFALNIILLVSIPFGTALAIYGFLKVDKPRLQHLPPPLPPN